jgi:hypothetical protein
MKENNERIPFEQVQKEIENAFKKMISDSCGTDIFQERNLIEAMIVSISNISIEYWQKREKISTDALLRLWNMSDDYQKRVMADVLKETDLYDNIVFDED